MANQMMTWRVSWNFMDLMSLISLMMILSVLNVETLRLIVALNARMNGTAHGNANWNVGRNTKRCALLWSRSRKRTLNLNKNRKRSWRLRSRPNKNLRHHWFKKLTPLNSQKYQKMKYQKRPTKKRIKIKDRENRVHITPIWRQRLRRPKYLKRKVNQLKNLSKLRIFSQFRKKRNQWSFLLKRFQRPINKRRRFLSRK